MKEERLCNGSGPLAIRRNEKRKILRNGEFYIESPLLFLEVVKKEFMIFTSDYYSQTETQEKIDPCGAWGSDYKRYISPLTYVFREI